MVRAHVRDALEEQLSNRSSRPAQKPDVRRQRSRLTLVAAMAALLVGLTVGAIVMPSNGGQSDLEATSLATTTPRPLENVDCRSGETGLEAVKLPTSGDVIGRIATRGTDAQARTAFLSAARGSSWEAIERKQQIQGADNPFPSTFSYLALSPRIDQESALSIVEEAVSSACSAANYLVVTTTDEAALADLICFAGSGGQGISGVAIVGDSNPPDCLPNGKLLVLLPNGSSQASNWAVALGCSSITDDSNQIQRPSNCDLPLVIGQATTEDPWESEFDGLTAADLIITIAGPG